MQITDNGPVLTTACAAAILMSVMDGLSTTPLSVDEKVELATTAIAGQAGGNNEIQK